MILKRVEQMHDTNKKYGGIGTFWAQKIIQEKSAIFTKILDFTKSSSINFFTKMSQYFH